MLTREIPAPAAQTGNCKRSLSFEKPYHRRNRVHGRNVDAHVHMVWHEMPFKNLPFVLPSQRVENLFQLTAEGRKVSDKVRVMVVPGAQEVKRQAIAEGLPEIFRAAGCEWREPGCSMCIAMNGDQLSPGQYSVSTSNRNFEGRQGKGGRTFLASPLTAAASAITGVVTDVRTLL